MRGRRPKPTALKVLAGNPGKRPLNHDEPKPEPVAPKCPSWLNRVAKREWKRVSPALEKLGLLTPLDMANLAAYCRTYAEMVEAQEFLAKHGLTYQIARRDTNGAIVDMVAQQWPQVAIVRRCQEEIRSYSAMFGMSPSDRSRMKVPGEQYDDEEFFGQTRRAGNSST